MQAKTDKNWIKPRHRMVRKLVGAVLEPICRWRYGISIEPFREEGDRAYLILYNHQTAFDQFFVGAAFSNPIYYMATEDIFSNGWTSALIRWLAAPIPIRKQTTDITAVMTCIKVAREGGTIAIAPEGNRTYNGKTVYMNPSIASLAKKLKLPIVLYRIEGGYGVQPRWSDVVRKGKMRSYVSEVIEPEDYADLSKEDLLQKIEQGLYVDESAPSGPFASAKKAEYLERAIYVCPYCGLSEFESHGNIAECKHCGRKIEYGSDKVLRGVGFQVPFTNVAQWYDYQLDFINALDVTQHTQSPLYTDRANVSEVIVYKKKIPLYKNTAIRLYGDRVEIDRDSASPLVLPFTEVTAASVLGRNKLNIYHGGKIYQFKGSKRFNALKYVNIYFRHKNISKGDTDGKFLGL